MSANVDYQALLHAMYFTPGTLHKTAKDKNNQPVRNWGTPGGAIFWSPPGSGKTTMLEHLGARVNAPVFVLDSTMGEGGLGATPVPDLEKGYLKFLPPDFFQIFEPPATGGVFVVDDMTTFAPALQPYLLGMLLSKRIGSSFLPPYVRVFGAANEPMDAPGGYDLAPAVANRGCHIDFPDAPLEDWCAGLVHGFAPPAANVNAAQEEARVLKAWPNAYAQAVGLMTGYTLAKRQDHRFHPNPEHPVLSKAFYTPRTKQFATIALASSFVHGLNEATTDVFVQGYVGEAFACSFGAWRREQDLPDAARFLDGEIAFEHNMYRIDRTAALLHSCCALVVPETAANRIPRAKVLYQLMDTVGTEAFDMIAAIMMTYLSKTDLVHLPEAKPIIKRLRPILEVRASPKAKGR